MTDRELMQKVLEALELRDWYIDQLDRIMYNSDFRAALAKDAVQFLTEDERNELGKEAIAIKFSWNDDYAEAIGKIEAKLKEKNGAFMIEQRGET